MKNKINKNEFIAISIAVFSLIISIITTLYNLLYYKDDFSVIVGGYPTFTFLASERAPEGDVNSVLFDVFFPANITFLNNGTRPVSIVNTRLWLVSAKEIRKKIKDCSKIPKEDIISIDSGPSIIDPFTAQKKNIYLRKFSTPKEGLQHQIVLGKSNENKTESIRAYACIEFGLITPGSNIKFVSKVLSTIDEANYEKVTEEEQLSTGWHHVYGRVGALTPGTQVSLIKEAHYFGINIKKEPPDNGLAGCLPCTKSHMF